MENNKNEKIPYQFTASPLNLMYILDSHCFKMLNLLIQEECYWRSQGKLVDGYFFKSINDLKDDMFMSNDQDVRLTIEALYSNGLVDVINQGDRHKASKFKVNMDKIIEIDSKSIIEVKKFYQKIYKLKRGCVCSYIEPKEVGNVSDIDKGSGSTTNCTTDCNTNCTTDSNTDCSTICTPKLDKLNLLNKSDLLNNIDDNIINNNIEKNNFEIESFDPLNTHIENNKKDKVEINDQKVTNAPAILAVAQPMEPTRKMTKGDQLINEFCQSYKEMKGNEFYEILNLYNIRDLEYIYKMISTLPIKLNANEKGYIKYYIARLQKRQKVA